MRRIGTMKPGWCFGLTVAMLAVFNVMRSAGLLGPAPLSSAVLLCATAAIAWVAGASPGDLGLRRRDLPAGLRYGFAAMALVIAVLVVAALIPATNDWLHDSRAAIPGGRMSYRIIVTILLCTVLPEELAFRGVLLGAALRLWGTTAAVVVTSLLFGTWHITTTLHTMSDNATVRHAPTVLVVLGAVASTAVAGAVFSWLRLRSGSLVAPALAHLATNAVALTVAWFVVH